MLYIGAAVARPQARPEGREEADRGNAQPGPRGRGSSAGPPRRDCRMRQCRSMLDATCNTLCCRMRHAVLPRATRHLATCSIPCCKVQHEVLQVATSNTPHPTCDIDHATCNMLCCTPCCSVHHTVLQHYAVCTTCSMLRATRTKCGVDNPACNAHQVAQAAATAHRACTRAAPPRAARSARPARR
jgi:hypothetical protein